MQWILRLLHRLDDAQRRHRVTATVVAVGKKFGDDRAGSLAALVAYYGFFSLFPLLLVLVTTAGFVLSRNESLRADLVDSTLAQFPVIGEQLELRSLEGSGVALVVGLLAALWAGLAALQAMQNAMNAIWDVPIKEQPNFFKARLRALLMLVVLGGGLVGTMVVGALGTFSARLGVAGSVVSLLLAVALASSVYLVAFKVLPATSLPWRALVPGAVVGGCGFVILQTIGGYYVTRTVNGSSEAYGVFALVIGLLSWLHLQAQIAIFAAEVNVVRELRLWPRSLFGDDLTEADVRALERYAKTEERRSDERVTMDLDPKHREDASAPTDAAPDEQPSPRPPQLAPDAPVS